MRNKFLVLFSVLIVGAMLLSACGGGAVETVIVEVDGETVIQTVVVEVEPEAAMKPVTLNFNFGTEPPTLDPSLTTDNISVMITGSLFGGLTNLDPVTNEVLPWLAESMDCRREC